MFRSPGAIAFKIGSLTVNWYGVIIGIGIVLCYFYIISELKRRKLEQKPVDDMALWIILAGILGARLYYVLFNFSTFAEHPLEILKIWHGGLAIHGALIGGALAYTVYMWKHKLSWFLYADIIIPGVLLAQGLGRWGNFLNNEAFGRPTELPWKLFIPLESRPEQYAAFSYFHPTFLYESLWNLIGFGLLIWLARKLYQHSTLVRRSSESVGGFHIPHSPGIIFFSYLIWYSIGRFFIESLRTDSLYLSQLRIAQVMSMILFVIGILGLSYLRKKIKIISTNP